MPIDSNLVNAALKYAGAASGAASSMGRAINPLLSLPVVYEKAKAILNPKDNIITALSDLGTSVENQFVPPQQRRLYSDNPRNEALNARILKSRAIGQDYTVNGITYDYKTGKAINPPANIFTPASQNGDTLAPPANNPAQRAQDQERSRIAQMTEQDPLFKKYRVAELSKAYNTASPEDKEKIGLEIWATTNPQLAQKLKPGQIGYTQATSAVMSQSPLGQFQAQTGDMQYANKMDQVPGAMAGFQPQTPLTGIPTPAAPQFGASEVFAKSTPIPGATEMFTDPRKFLSQEELSQTQLALLKKAFESRIK